MAVVYRNRWGRARRGRRFRSWAMGGLIAFLLLFILVEQQIEPFKIPITQSLIVGKMPEYLYNHPDGKPDVPMPRKD